MTIQAARDARSTFPAILRELLEKHPQTGKRTTLKELGEAVGTRQQSISLYRNGDTQPSPDILVRIAAFFGVSVDYLLTGVSCTGMGSSGIASLNGNSLTLSAAATAPGANIVCTFRGDLVFRAICGA